jgi:hypothetical protein
VRIPDIEQYRPIKHGELKLLAATCTPWLILCGLWNIPVVGGYLVCGGLTFMAALCYAVLRKDRKAKLQILRDWLDKLSRDSVWGTELRCSKEGKGFKLSFERAWTRCEAELAIIIPLGGWFRRPRIVQKRELESWRVSKCWVDFDRHMITVRLSDGHNDPIFKSPQRALQYLLRAPSGHSTANDVLEELLRENHELGRELNSFNKEIDRLHDGIALTPVASTPQVQ